MGILPAEEMTPDGAAFIPDGTLVIKKGHFRSAEITSVTLPESVKRIEQDAFRECILLEKISFDANLTAIHSRAFLGCKTLRQVALPNKIKKLSSGVFEDCSALANVRLPKNAKEIGERAFANCTSLASVHIPKSVEEIGAGAFAGCSSLREIVLENSGIKIAEGAIEGCPRDIEIRLPRCSTNTLNQVRANFGLPDENGWLIDSTVLRKYMGPRKSLRVPDRVRKIATGAFSGFSDFGSCEPIEVKLPLGLRIIEPKTGLEDAGNVEVRFPADYLQQLDLNGPSLFYAGSQGWLYNVRPMSDACCFLQKEARLADCARDFLRSETGIRELISAMREYRPLNAPVRMRLVRFFIENRSLFTCELEAEFASALYTCRTNETAQLQTKVDCEYPEAVLDEFLADAGIDPDVSAWFTVYTTDGKLVSSRIVKNAVYLYVRAATELVQGGRSPEKVQIPFIPKAEAILASLNAEDISAVFNHVPSIRRDTSKRRHAKMAVLSRFGSEQALCRMYSDVKGIWDRDGALSKIAGNFAVLSPTSSAVEWMGKLAKGKYKYADPLIRYVRGLCGEDCLSPKLPSFVAPDEDGYLVFESPDGPLYGEISDRLSLVLRARCSATNPQPSSVSCTARMRRNAKRNYEALSIYLNALQTEIDKSILQWYIGGTGLKPKDFEMWIKDPILSKALSGIVFQQGDADFVLCGNGCINRSGDPVTVQLSADTQPITVAHVCSLGEEAMGQWKSVLAEKCVESWHYQLSEPLYNMADIDSQRYKGMRVCVAASAFPLDTNILLSEFDGPFISAAEISEKSSFQLGPLSVASIERRSNHLLYVLDTLTASEQVRRGNLSILPVLKGVSLTKLKALMDIALRSEQTEFVAALLKLLNERSNEGIPVSEELHI